MQATNVIEKRTAELQLCNLPYAEALAQAKTEYAEACAKARREYAAARAEENQAALDDYLTCHENRADFLKDM